MPGTTPSTPRADTQERTEMTETPGKRSIYDLYALSAASAGLAFTDAADMYDALDATETFDVSGFDAPSTVSGAGMAEMTEMADGAAPDMADDQETTAILSRVDSLLTRRRTPAAQAPADAFPPLPASALAQSDAAQFPEPAPEVTSVVTPEAISEDSEAPLEPIAPVTGSSPEPEIEPHIEPPILRDVEPGDEAPEFAPAPASTAQAMQVAPTARFTQAPQTPAMEAAREAILAPAADALEKPLADDEDLPILTDMVLADAIPAGTTSLAQTARRDDEAPADAAIDVRIAAAAAQIAQRAAETLADDISRAYSERLAGELPILLDNLLNAARRELRTGVTAIVENALREAIARHQRPAQAPDTPEYGTADAMRDEVADEASEKSWETWHEADKN